MKEVRSTIKVRAEENNVVVASVQKAADRNRAGIFFIFGSLSFLLLTTAAEAIYPSFSLQTNAISDLAAVGTSTMLIEGIAIIGLGICWFAGGYYLFRNTGKRRLMILNVLPGIGFLIAGLVPENVNVVVHSLGAIAFPAGAVIATLSSRIILSRFRYFAIAMGVISLVSTFVLFAGWRVVCGTCGYMEGIGKLYLGLGGWESMIVYPLLVWLTGFGSYLLALNRRE